MISFTLLIVQHIWIETVAKASFRLSQYAEHLPPRPQMYTFTSKDEVLQPLTPNSWYHVKCVCVLSVAVGGDPGMQMALVCVCTERLQASRLPSDHDKPCAHTHTHTDTLRTTYIDFFQGSGQKNVLKPICFDSENDSFTDLRSSLWTIYELRNASLNNNFSFY